MTDVQTVTMGLSVLVCLRKITDFISESNHLPVWVNTVGEVATCSRNASTVIVSLVCRCTLRIPWFTWSWDLKVTCLLMSARQHYSPTTAVSCCIFEDIQAFYPPCWSRKFVTKGSIAQTKCRLRRRGADVWQLLHPSICPPGPSTS